MHAERVMRAFLLRYVPKHVSVYYMHIMMCHCHEIIEMHGSLNKFSCQRFAKRQLRRVETEKHAD
jgi:NAD-dependent SIR2 family protein deacetylase